jgi:hypothetical protein
LKKASSFSRMEFDCRSAACAGLDAGDNLQLYRNTI